MLSAHTHVLQLMAHNAQTESSTYMYILMFRRAQNKTVGFGQVHTQVS